MINPRWIKILRELWQNKTRTLLIVLAISVGVAAFGIMAISQVVLERDMDDQFISSNPAHGILTIASFGDDLVDDVRQMENIEVAEARRIIGAKLKIGPDELMALELHAIPDFETLAINRLKLESGASLPNKNQILLERSAQYMMNTDVGETVQIMMANGTLFETEVAGLVNDLAPMPSQIYAIAYGYIPFDTLESLGEPQKYNRLLVFVTGDPDDRIEVERVITNVANEVEAQGYPVLRADVFEPGKPPLDDSLATCLILFGIMGTLSLVLSAFLVANVSSAIVTEQISHIGIMKSIGGRTHQILLLYLQMVVVFGMLALIVSVPLGVAGAHFMAGFIAKQQLDIDIISLGLPPQIFALQIVGAVGIPIVGALIPILIGARITVVEAIRGYGLTSGGIGGPFGRLLLKLERIPLLLMLSVRNVFRRSGRLTLTLLALGLGGAMFISVLSIYESLPAYVDNSAEEWAHDVEIDMGQLYPIDTLESEALEVSEVTYVESWGMADARRVFEDGRRSGSFKLIGLPYNSKIINPLIVDGNWLLPGEEHTAFVNDHALKIIHEVGVGDEITLKVGDSVEAWRVVGTSVKPIRYEPIIYVHYQDFERAIGLEGHTNRVLVQTDRDDPVSQSIVEANLLHHFDSVGFGVIHSDTTGNVKESVDTQISGFIFNLIGIAMLVAVVGAIGLASTMGLNVMDRTRDIGILRALGAKSRTIRQLIIMESLAIGLSSCVLGIALSIPLSLFLDDVIGMTFFSKPLEYIFPVTGVVIWIGLVIVFSVAASWAPSQRAIRLTVKETLAYEG